VKDGFRTGTGMRNKALTTPYSDQKEESNSMFVENALHFLGQSRTLN